jgi:hypothetical protein
VLPVSSLIGEIVSRSGFWLLKAVGLEELAAEDELAVLQLRAAGQQ